MIRSVKIESDVVDQPLCHLDCDDVLHRNRNVQGQGVFRIRPRTAAEPFDVLCLFEREHGDEKNDFIAWTIIQRRINGTVNFYRGWNAYRDGFGDLQSEFWLGNERIHQLTQQDQYG